jgi:hypothetical protein
VVFGNGPSVICGLMDGLAQCTGNVSRGTGVEDGTDTTPQFSHVNISGIAQIQP